METSSVNHFYSFRMIPQSTYDVVVVAAHGLRAAARARQAADDRDWVALEAELARDVLQVEPEEGQDRRARGRVRLDARVSNGEGLQERREGKVRTFSRLLQHWTGPVLQLATWRGAAVAAASAAKARVETAARRENMTIVLVQRGAKRGARASWS